MMDVGSSRLPVLAVDLDGTLINTDLLYESFWGAFGQSWVAPFTALMQLPRGRASLKRELGALAQLDVATLPFRREVLDYVRRWREAGGRTALVTAADADHAARIAAHLGLFDEVHGSDGRNNLKGSAKANFLASHFGEDGYAYLGDCTADLAVWRRARRAVTVGAGPRLRARVDGIAPEAEHLDAPGRRLSSWARALRAHQWLKNLLIFLPLLAGHMVNAEALLRGAIAFLAFSLVASSVYLVNDLLDLATDRGHPRKRHRPFASGALSIAQGTWVAPLLLLAGVALALPLGLEFLGVLALYYVTTSTYSLYLKRKVVIDISALAGLYTMRILAGGVATHTPLSMWLLAFAIFFFFSLAAVKRQAELTDSLAAGKTEAGGRGYQVRDLPLVMMMAISSGYVSVAVLALYVNSEKVTTLYRLPEALWGVCLIVFYWVNRMVMITHRGDMHDDPVVFAVTDRISQICLLIAFAFAAIGIVA
jgi:4-hydroxybenzoate polyprenyltransferase/phosphoserine phosphatase